ncbi:MAG: cytochrome c [Rhodocyclaceae bacterium]
MKKVMAFIALAAFASTAALAADGAKLYAEKTCTACHGKDGKKTLMPDYPKIAGQNKAYIEKQMKDIKSGTRANGNSAAMKGVMEIVSDAEIKDLAEFVSQMK